MSTCKKLKRPVSDIMIEFFRRQYVIHDGQYQPLGNLGFPSEMKEAKSLGLIKPYSREEPRVLNWYQLTEKGLSVINAYLDNGLSGNSFSNYDIEDHQLDFNIRNIVFNLETFEEVKHAYN